MVAKLASTLLGQYHDQEAAGAFEPPELGSGYTASSSSRTSFRSSGSVHRMDVPGVPGATNAQYWEALSKRRRYDSKIFNSARDDKDGVVRRFLDRAVLRAQGTHGEGHRLKVVDIGCGPGKWLPALNYRFDDVKAIDISQGLLDKAQRVVERRRLDNVDVLPAQDMGRPCEFDQQAEAGKRVEKNGRQLCGPRAHGTKDADVVVSMNSLISPDALSRSRMLRRAADMLRPTVNSTLLLVVPSRESFLRIRSAFRSLGLAKKLGKLEDFSVDHPEEEAKNIFRAGLVPTQFFTRQSICAEVEAAGFECRRVKEMPYKWHFALPGVTHRLESKLPRDKLPHLLVVEAHPKTSSALGSHRARNSSLGAGATQEFGTARGKADESKVPEKSAVQEAEKAVSATASVGAARPAATADFL